MNEIVSENQADEIERGRVSLAEDSYDLLAKMLGENFGWSVVSREQLLAHPTYHELYQQRMRGMWTPHLANTRGDSVLAPGILPAGIMRYLGPAERQALAQDLGVDAVAIIEVSYVVGDKSGFAVGDIGSETYYPAARSYLLLYDGSGEEPIWCDPGAMGAPASEGFQHIMGVNKWADMPKILFETTQSSFAQLLSRYKTYHGEE